MFVRNDDQEFYTPEQDVTEEGADGVARLVAAAGVPVPMEQAKRLGLIKPAKKAEPQEVKADEQPKAKR